MPDNKLSKMHSIKITKMLTGLSLRESKAITDGYWSSHDLLDDTVYAEEYIRHLMDLMPEMFSVLSADEYVPPMPPERKLKDASVMELFLILEKKALSVPQDELLTGLVLIMRSLSRYGSSTNQLLLHDIKDMIIVALTNALRTKLGVED